MMKKTFRAYGLWDSPLSPEMMSGSMRIGDLQWHADTLVWVEQRGDRGVLVMQQGNEALRDLTDSGFNVRGRVGYGGGEFTVAGGQVFFVHHGRLHRVALSGGVPRAITPAFGGAASPSVSPDGRWVVFVHSYEHQDVLAIVDSDGGHWPQKLASGSDFVMQPAWHPGGEWLAYVAWNHPQMPWNGTQLRLIRLSNQGVLPQAENEVLITGDENTSIFQPEFSPDGRYLSYVSDADGWWHLYLYDLQTDTHRQITFGQAEDGLPAWGQGMRTYGWSADSHSIYYLRTQLAVGSVWSYSLRNNHSHQIDALAQYSAFDRISVAPDGDRLALLASSSLNAPRILSWQPQHGIRVIRRATSENLTTAHCSPAQPIAWNGHDGEPVYGLYYAPQHPTFEASGIPPLIVLVHGGPTGQRQAAYDEEVLYFTTRGFAVLHVNHRGSTGYGKAYVNKHQGNWGVYDVQDSITGAQYLIDQGLADPAKTVIMGGSAGGYTVLQALVDAPGFFKAGICLYGISNQFMLAMDTHKFEERYNDWLLGALPEAAEKYRDRSPLFHADRIRDALILFQGTEDTVVPRNQADAIVAVLRRHGVPYEYHVYEGEGHGFRKPETRIDFYARVIHFLKQYVIFA
jgi:dipeptidyl aminopeptidase/acylaminoacyl peptidase